MTDRSKPLELLHDGEPDVLDLEMLRVGAVDDDAIAARIEAAADAGLAGEDRALRDYRAWFESEAPPLPWSEPSLEQDRPAASAPAQEGSGGRVVSLPRPLRWAVPLAAAAAVVIGLFVFLPQRDAPDDEGWRTMGGLPLELSVLRDGRAWAVPAAQFRPGDQLLTRARFSRSGYATLATVQDNGEVFLLRRSEPGKPLAAGHRFQPRGAVELDDYPGREWLVLRIDSEYLPEPELEVSLRVMIDEARVGPGVQEVVDGYMIEVTRER